MGEAAETPVRRLRDAAGRFATGVTVVTTRAPDGVHGMTANGFMSVSLEPALIVVSIGNSSRTKELLEESGAYGVSILSEGQRQLSAHFAGRPLGDGEVGFTEVEQVPLIAGAVAHLAARVVDAHAAGDHTLFVGEVVHIDVLGGEPLVFHGGAYRALRPRPEVEWTVPWGDRHAWM